ncbi:hypothetical protein [Polaromonas sp.]|uniref:hypothetical protein n=1 Tax=Polaromonas sp. TaxID=1869339 RepID=UPI003BACAD64
MTTAFTLQFLQDHIGEQYIELNPVTGQPRFIHGLNEVWQKLDEHGGVGQVAKVFGLSEAAVWAWVDDHEIPKLYIPYLIDRDQRVSDVQLSSSGYEDTVSGECWPRNWRLESSDIMGVVRN